MTEIDAFRRSTTAATPAAELSPALQALWWVRRGDWDRAHGCVQQHEGEPECDLVHAHLHRQEGDLGNARHWYRQVGQSLPTVSLETEWDAIAADLLAESGGRHALPSPL